MFRNFMQNPYGNHVQKKKGTQNKVIINGNIDYTRNPRMISVENFTHKVLTPGLNAYNIINKFHNKTYYILTANNFDLISLKNYTIFLFIYNF